MVNAVGHAITGGYDETELPRMKFLVDRDFIKEPRPNLFWHELLRNQLYYASKEDPLPVLETWETRGHPFLERYTRNGRLNFNELFWKQCAFVPSHDHFEIRIADAVNTIVSRYFNKYQCRDAYALIRQCFLRDGRIQEVILNDFDLVTWRYDPADNPWRKIANESLEPTPAARGSEVEGTEGIGGGSIAPLALETEVHAPATFR
jgi:hypothetical protein